MHSLLDLLTSMHTTWLWSSQVQKSLAHCFWISLHCNDIAEVLISQRDVSVWLTEQAHFSRIFHTTPWKSHRWCWRLLLAEVFHCSIVAYFVFLKFLISSCHRIRTFARDIFLYKKALANGKIWPKIQLETQLCISILHSWLHFSQRHAVHVFMM